MDDLKITSAAFENGKSIPKIHTGFDADVSPDFKLHNLSKSTVSVAATMIDLDVPFFSEYPHWLIWNLPPDPHIPGDIPHGAELPNGAVQGVAYGKNCYRGPKPPSFTRKPHRYVFRFYALDCHLQLSPGSKYMALARAMRGHIIQSGSIMGLYKR